MTDRKKLGDGVDMMLHFAGIAKARGESEVISDYPETVQNVLKAFVKVWGISEDYIPRKGKSGKGEYSQWVKEIQDITGLCGSYPEKVMSDSLALYQELNMNFMVTHPAAIKKLLLEVKRRKNLSRPKELMDNTVEKVDSNPDSLNSMVENLKKDLFGE